MLTNRLLLESGYTEVIGSLFGVIAGIGIISLIGIRVLALSATDRVTRGVLGRPQLNQAGLQAVYDDLIQTKPEVEAVMDREGILVVPNPNSVPGGKKFALVISDSATSERAALARDNSRRELLASDRAKKMAPSEAQLLVKKAIKTSGRYLIFDVGDGGPDVGTPEIGAGMEWLGRHYALD